MSSEYRERKRRKKMIRVVESLIEPLFKNAQYHEMDVLPEDAVFEKAFMDKSGYLNLVFSSEEWPVLGEGDTIPLHDVNIKSWTCYECSSELFLDEENEMMYCPICDNEQRY